MTHSNFKNQIDNLMDILFGSGVASHQTIIEQINYLVFLRAISKKDDNAIKLDPSAEKIFNKELTKYHWDNLLMLNAEVLFTTLEEIYRQLPELSTDQTIKLLFRDAHVKVFDKPTLRRLVHEIEKMMANLEQEAATGHTDIFGDMYEYLLSKLSQAKTLGSFRTPRHIIKFIVDVINPQKGETILDPACGTAGFLVAALQNMKEKYTSKDFKKLGKFSLDKLDPKEQEFLFRDTFTGFDSDSEMYKFGVMNLYLHQLEHPNIKRQNTLVDTAGDRTKWDIILANPPFAGALDKESISEDLQMNTRATEVLFVRYMIDHLSSNGRAGVIIPEGLLFNGSNAYKKIRQMLLEDAGLWCVVSLPAGVFNPYAGVKTSIIFFDKNKVSKVKEILFIKIANDGFDLGATKRAINKNDLPEAIDILDKWIAGEKTESTIATYVEKSKIAENGGYNLSGDRYRITTDYTNAKWPMVELGEICEIFNGSTPKRTETSYWENGTIPWFTINDIRGQGRYIFSTKQTITEKGFKKSSVKLLPKYSTLLCCTASIGECAYTEIELTTNQQFNGLVVKSKYREKLNPKFLFWCATTFKDELERMSGKATFGFVSVSTLKKFQIPLPPLEIQEQIVAELDGHAGIISGAKQIATNWKPRIDISPEWKKVKLMDISKKITQGPNPKYDGAKEDKYRVLKTKDLYDDVIYYNNADKISANVFESCKTSKLLNGDILIAIVGQGSINKSNVFSFQGKEKFIFTRALGLLRLNHKIANPYFVLFSLQSKAGKDLIDSGIGGTSGQQVVTTTHLKNLQIPLPPLKIQRQIVEKIEAERALVDSAKKLIKIYEQKTKETIAKLWIK